MELPTVEPSELEIKPRRRVPKAKKSARKRGKRPAGITEEIRGFIRADKGKSTYKVLANAIAKKFKIKPKSAEYMIWAERKGWYKKRWKARKRPKRAKRAKHSA
jgi:hypothetical protein